MQKQPHACSAQQLFLETASSAVRRRCSALQMRTCIWTLFLSTRILCGSTLEMLHCWDSPICVLLDSAFQKGIGHCLATFILFMTFCLSHFLRFLKLGKKLGRVQSWAMIGQLENTKFSVDALISNCSRRWVVSNTPFYSHSQTFLTRHFSFSSSFLL